jgi:hypothetical protein
MPSDMVPQDDWTCSRCQFVNKGVGSKCHHCGRARPARRITLRHEKAIRKFLLVEPPYPDVGDQVNIDGVAWTVSKMEDADLLLGIPMGGKQ